MVKLRDSGGPASPHQHTGSNVRTVGESLSANETPTPSGCGLYGCYLVTTTITERS